MIHDHPFPTAVTANTTYFDRIKSLQTTVNGLNLQYLVITIFLSRKVFSLDECTSSPDGITKTVMMHVFHLSVQLKLVTLRLSCFLFIN